MSAHLQSEKGTTRGIYIAITPDIIAQTGWIVAENDQRKSVRVLVQEGVGDDAGFLLLTEDPAGYSLGTTNKTAKSFSMSITSVKFQHYVLNEVPVPPEIVEYTVDEKDHTLLIQCPDWLRYNSLSYTPPAPPPKVEPPRPTRAEAASGDASAPLHLNRQQRRKLVSKVVSALR